MRIAVIGVGGLGGYIGGRLAQAGQEVTFLARGDRLHALRANGLQVRSLEGAFVIQPSLATDNPANVGTVDLILFCVKTYDVASAATLLPSLVGAQTALLPVQNGIGHLEALRSVAGDAAVLGGVAIISAHSPAPGVIERPGGPQRIEFGELDGSLSPRCTAIAQALAAAGIDAPVSPKIEERMWWKFAAICGAGVFSVMRGSKALIWAEPETKELMRQAIAEAVAVAHAKGVPLSPTLPEDTVTGYAAFPPAYKPSMLVDLEQGRRLEVEALNGAMSRLGKAVGVATPVNDFIYACLKPYVHGMPKP